MADAPPPYEDDIHLPPPPYSSIKPRHQQRSAKVTLLACTAIAWLFVLTLCFTVSVLYLGNEATQYHFMNASQGRRKLSCIVQKQIDQNYVFGLAEDSPICGRTWTQPYSLWNDEQIAGVKIGPPTTCWAQANAPLCDADTYVSLVSDVMMSYDYYSLRVSMVVTLIISIAFAGLGSLLLYLTGG